MGAEYLFKDSYVYFKELGFDSAIFLQQIFYFLVEIPDSIIS
jgi:hypothetical protein